LGLRKYDFTAVVNIPIFFVSAVGLAMQRISWIL